MKAPVETVTAEAAGQARLPCLQRQQQLAVVQGHDAT